MGQLDYLDQPKTIFIVFGRDETEFHHENYIPLLQLESMNIESLANKTIILEVRKKNLKQK